MVRGLAIACVVLLAGCAGERPAEQGVQAAPELAIAGIVVSQTIVPIEGANVSIEDGSAWAVTDASGRFSLGPLDPGQYTLVARAAGYGDVRLQAAPVEDAELLKIVLVPVSTEVPYATTEYFQGYLECTIDTWVAPYQILGAPCIGVVDVLTGMQVSTDEWQFVWQVDDPGFAGILIEMVWDEQATGDRMGLLLRNVVGAGGGVDAGGTNVDTQFFSNHGLSPMRSFVQQGIENPGADDGAVFHPYQNETGVEYKILILGRADYSQPADVHLMLQYEPEIFLTKFYHAMGDESFTVL